MSTLTKMTRTMKKLEVPRPLKSTSGSTQQTRSSLMDYKITTLDDLIMLTEVVASELTRGNYDGFLQNNVTLMYQHLKTQGGQLEALYKDLLDRFFVIFRNGSLDDNLDKKSRLHLLELIELRAKQWKESDHMTHYYKQRGTNAEPNNSVSDTIINNENPIYTIPLSPMEQLLLAPGEIIKTSGKFTKPTKIPGKNYSKDEVVIRNADSGKVMGIKGRRVHMIEELSDTIISFQRVNPGAKERLVQITGPNEENVNHAKHLIGDTIRRNASPVRLEDNSGNLGDSTSSLNSSASEENGRQVHHNPARPLLHSYSTNDANFGEFRYTVAVGTHSIKITGDNLSIVNMAKLVLDDYFENINSLETPVSEYTDVFNFGGRHPLESMGSTYSSQEYNNNGSVDNFKGNGLPSPDEEVFMKIATSTEKSQSKLCYTREMLLHYSTSPLSKQPPNIVLPPELMRKASLDFNGEKYLQKQKEARVSTSGSDDAKNSPEPA